MNDAHLHLIVNHLPIIGMFLAAPVLLLAFARAEGLGALRAGALLLALGAIGAGAAVATGDDAEEVVEDLPGVSEDLIHEHEEKAETAAIVAAIAALVGLGALGLSHKRGAVHKGALAGALGCNLLTAGLMADVGASGGVIRHTEIRDAADAQMISGQEAGGEEQGGEAKEAEENEENEQGEGDEG